MIYFSGNQYCAVDQLFGLQLFMLIAQEPYNNDHSGIRKNHFQVIYSESSSNVKIPLFWFIEKE